MQHFIPIRLVSLTSSLTHSVNRKFISTLCLSMLFLLFSVQVQAQDDDWTLDSTVENVDLMYQLVDCDGAKAVLLKFNNKNAFEVKVTWKQVIATEEMPNNTQESVQSYELSLPSGVSAPDGCKDDENTSLIITPFEVDPTHMVLIQDFGFSSIIVERI